MKPSRVQKRSNPKAKRRACSPRELAHLTRVGRRRSIGWVGLTVAWWACLGGCDRSPDALTPAAPKTSPAVAAMQRVLSADEWLGRTRNLAPHDVPLSTAIKDYVAGIDQLDFTGCPPEFSAAFQRHRDAWHDSIPFFDGFPALRGEMHDLFDTIRARADVGEQLVAIEKSIWDTWAEVEAAMAKYDVPASS